MKTISLLLLLCAGCSTRTWTETTDTWRAVGPSEQRVETRGLEDQWLEVKGTIEDDGFAVRELLRTDERGETSFSLLPSALQVLVYGHTVTLEFRRYENGTLVHTSAIDEAGARAAVKEWHVQVRLGAKPKLRPAEIKLLDRLISQSGDTELVAMLEEIKPAVTTRFEWE